MDDVNEPCWRIQIGGPKVADTCERKVTKVGNSYRVVMSQSLAAKFRSPNS